MAGAHLSLRNGANGDYMKIEFKMNAAAVMIIAIALAGCSILTFYPYPTPEFEAKVDYPVSLDSAWNSVIEVLALERAGTVYQSTYKDRIVTGYFTGATGGSQMQDKARWSYVISFAKLGESKTRILVDSKVERVLKGWGYTYSWRDISDAPGAKKNLINPLNQWLYEKIEAQISTPRPVS